MTTAAADAPPSGSGRATALLAYGLSVALHAALFAAILRLPPVAPERRATPVAVEIIETPRAAPPEPAPRPAPAPAPGRPLPAPRLLRPPLVRAPTTAPPTPAPAPPPPNAPAASGKPSEIRIGVSMSSTSAAGTVAAPVGNTAMGQAPRVAGEPSEVKPYRADRYAPPTEVTSLPIPVRVDLPRSEYPPDALRDGFEGVVKLRLVVDEEGNVREATVLSDPGRGLGAAAARAAKRWFKFRPARKDGAAVATEIPFTVEFQIQ